MNGASGVTAGAYTTSLQRVGYVSASEFTEKFLQSDDGGVIAEIPEGRENSAARVHMTLRFVDDATYGKYLEALGLSAAEYGVEKGRLPAVAKKTGYDSARQRTVAFDVFQNSSVTIPLAPVSAPAGDAYPAMTDKLWFYPRIFIFALFAIIFEFLIMRLPSGYIWTVIPLTQLAPALAYLLFIFVFKNMFVPIKVNVNRKIIGKSVLAIVVPVLLGGAVYIIGNMFKIDNNLNENIRNFLPNGGALLLYLIIGSIGEEIGWRGFLKPTLEKRHSVLLSNVIVGIIWALWHIDRYTAGSIYWATFLPMIVSFSIIMAIILKDTMNNMIISVLIHTMFNLSFMIFLGNSFMDTRVMIITSVVLSLAAIVVIIANREYFTIRSGIK
jgi:membrane protease YdiL (CAAX protease family)